MKKQYLAGFGAIQRTDTISDCKGYFRALRDEGMLKGKILTGAGNGWVPVGEKDEYGIFCKMFGNDMELWGMLTTKAKQDKRNSINVIRAEVDERKGLGLSGRLVHLSENYPVLGFFIYSSDIEAKS